MGNMLALKPSSRPLAFHVLPSQWMSALTLTSVCDILLADVYDCFLASDLHLYSALQRPFGKIK